MNVSPCPNCGGTNQYRSKEVSAGGGHAPNYLPGLGGFLRSERFHVVLCKTCGLARFFARDEARKKVSESNAWQHV